MTACLKNRSMGPVESGLIGDKSAPKRVAWRDAPDENPGGGRG